MYMFVDHFLLKNRSINSTEFNFADMSIKYTLNFTEADIISYR